MKLVEEWQKCWKWASVQLAALAAIALELYQQFPQFQQYIPDQVFHHAMSIFVALIIVGRVVQKNNVPPQ